jgi:hypothetical protein
VIAIGLVACDLSDKTAADRPEQFDYIVETILAPSCGTAECHSAMKAQSGDVFDNVQGAHDSLISHSDLVMTCSRLQPPEDQPCGKDAANGSYLFTVLEQGQGVISDIGYGDVMPLDQTLNSADRIFIGQWIDDGAEGFDFKAAQ